MSVSSGDLMRWNRGSVSLGAISWTLLTILSLRGWGDLDATDLILLLALLVITPLALPLALDTHSRQHGLHAWRRVTIIFQPGATLIGALSFFLRTGPLAAVAAAVWLVFSGFIAVQGVGRLLRVGRPSLPDICSAVALVYLPIGGIWLVAARWGLQPFGYPPDIVILTAVHFHYIPLTALVMTAAIGRVDSIIKPGLPRTLYRFVALGMIADPLLVAAGNTLAHFTGNQSLLTAASTLLALTLILIAGLSLRFIIPSTASPIARGLLLVSSTAVLFTMLAAGAYALGNQTGAWTITISQMIDIHGWINALVFGLCGLLGWRLRLGK